VVSCHRLIGLGDLFGGDIEHQFASAIRIQDRPMLMVVIVTGVVVIGMIVAFMVMLVVPFMIVAFVIVSGLSRVKGRGVFEGVYRTQSFAFRARTPRQQICRS